MVQLAGYAAKRWLGARSVTWAVAAAVASHWLLDVIVHRPDMTLWGTPPKLGLGIWNYPAPALALELGLLIGCALACLRAGAIAASRRRAVFVLVGVLAALQLGTTLSPPAFGPMGVAASGLFVFALAAWGARRVEASGPG